MKILKFGGTSVSTETSLLNLNKIVSSYNLNEEQLIIVVSALKGVTNDLNLLLDLISIRDRSLWQLFSVIKERHWKLIALLFTEEQQRALKSKFHPLEEEFRFKLKRLYEKAEIGANERDDILAYGELFSANIVSFFLKSKGHFLDFLDARKLIITDDSYGNANLARTETYERMRDFFQGSTMSYVVPGFIGSTLDGKTTTLGRGGSDYTATIFGAVLKANSVTKWTDVDGIMTADPRRVEKADSLREITFDELQSLSYLGPNVLVHQDSIKELSRSNVPIVIKNTFNLKFSGTMISNKSIQGKRMFSLNNTCTIIGISKKHLIPKNIIRAVRKNGYLLFRIKLQQPEEINKSCFLVSNECLNFIIEQLKRPEYDSVIIDNIQDFDVIYPKVCLVSITNCVMDKKAEIRKALFLLGLERIYPVAYRVFSNSCCLLLKSSDATKAFGYLYDKLVNFDKPLVHHNM